MAGVDETGVDAARAALSAAIEAGDAEAVLAAFRSHSAGLLRSGDVVLLGRGADVVSRDGVLPAAVAWRYGYALHVHGRYDEAVGVYERAGRLEELGEGPDTAQLLAAFASSRWAQGNATASRDLADRAVAAAEACRDASAQASAWVAQALVCALEGDRNGNRIAYERALAAADVAGDLTTQVRIHNNLGSREHEEGQSQRALEHLDRAIALSDDGVAPALRALTYINRGEALLALGRLEEALAEFELSRGLAEQADSPMLSHAVLGIGDTNVVRGNATQAAVAYREAVELGARNGDAQVLVPALSGLARASIGEDLDEAQGMAKRALDQPAALGQVCALLAAGWLSLACERPERAAELASVAVREAGRRRDPRSLAEALELRALAMPRRESADELEEAATLWSAAQSPIGLAVNAVLQARVARDAVAEQAARRQLRSLGVRDDASRIAGPLQAVGAEASADVAIRALGAFAVFLDGEPVPASAWQSRKSRDALKILVGRAGRPITRDALCEHLWPEVAGSGNRLSVVLSTLRGVLDPAKRFPSDHFVVADRESVRLDVTHVEIDTLLFTGTATAALAAARAGAPHAVDALERAAALYSGHYLDDDPYSDWALDTRDRLLSLSIEVKRELADALIVSGETRRAIPWLVGLVADDPYDEPSHHALVRTLAQARRHGDARRYHRAYATRMAEIGAEVTPLEELT